MMWWYGDHMGGWGVTLMVLNMVLFWALVVAGVVLLVRYLGRTRPEGGRLVGADAERILAERFARGEIDEEEYHSRLAAVRRGAAR
ncbi:MAG TPA: SHOCT domain-containing protein [Micromonospora sp.]